MTSELQQLVSADRLRRFCAAALERVGVPQKDAGMVADNLVDADLRGIDTHGIVRLPNYIARVRAGGIAANAPVTVVSDSSSIVVLDAHDGFGQVAGTRAMRLAIDRAGEHGIAAVAVRNSNHLGTLAYYARMAVGHEMVGLAVSGAAPGIAPWGGAEPLLGSNPWSIAFPVRGHAPLVVDMANGVVIAGKIRAAAERGDPIPRGWALDRDGLPTEDARAAAAGSVFPFGGAKGAALTLALEVLASVLTGAAYSTQIPELSQTERPQRLGHFFLALRVDRFLPVEEFHDRLGDLLNCLEHSRVAAGRDRIRIPGVRGESAMAEHLAHGIPIPPRLLDQLARLADDLGIEHLL